MALRVRVCRLADVVPGELNPFKVKGVTWPVILAYVGSDLVACAGVCPHEDVALAEGYLHESVVMCPAHSYTFNLHTGKCSHDASLNLRRYNVTVVGDDVYVDLI
ncbi:MAG: Rieske 2Fe-2S domain-containing protein [Deltaproteobacteria bacterium]|nr:Rieske 2Fe-2S domain-containing protein [Deltaproteobacteria bacterium]